MGIPNFTLLLDPLMQDYKTLDPFDSILVDCQSFLYIAIEYSFQDQEPEVFYEIGHKFQAELAKQLKTIFAACRSPPKHCTIVLSFDGEGVPMKFPTQRKRRDQVNVSDRKKFYKTALFGNNVISRRVQNQLVQALKTSAFMNHFSLSAQYPDRWSWIVSGCDIPGEGEHKLFHLAEALHCRNPLVVSVDNDVYVIAFLRLQRYATFQIAKSKQFYNLSEFVRRLPYSVECLVYATFLFGNDFLPPLVTISANNFTKIHNVLSTLDHRTIPDVVFSFLEGMRNELRFDTVSYVDRTLVVNFWITCLWILDYYQNRHFPQKNMSNPVYDSFDRNMLLTALLDYDFALDTFREAQRQYEEEGTPFQTVQPSAEQVFGADALAKIASYLRETTDKAVCNVIEFAKTSR